jgi:hypothetical protein
MKSVLIFTFIYIGSLYSQNIDFKTFIQNDYTIFTKENVKFYVDAPIFVKKLKIKEIKEYQIKYEYDSLHKISKKSERLLNTIRFDTAGNMISFNNYKVIYDQYFKSTFKDTLPIKVNAFDLIIEGKYLNTDFYEYHEYRDFSKALSLQ